MSGQKIPLSRSLLWILGSTLLISGTAFMGWLYILHVKERRLQDEKYNIIAIVQSTTQADALKSAYLAELLGLSLDQPINLYQFNTEEGIKKLMANPLIKEASIKKILPGTLLIQYQMRMPVAYLGEYANTAIDDEGTLFPFNPFFTPKHLPIIFLNLEKEKGKWGNCLKEEPLLKKTFLILKEFEFIKQDKFKLGQLDVIQAEAECYGQRQVVVTLEKADQKIYLRLNADDTAQCLMNFFTLHEALFEKIDDLIVQNKTMVVDLRIPHLAFIRRQHDRKVD